MIAGDRSLEAKLSRGNIYRVVLETMLGQDAFTEQSNGDFMIC